MLSSTPLGWLLVAPGYAAVVFSLILWIEVPRYTQLQAFVMYREQSFPLSNRDTPDFRPRAKSEAVTRELLGLVFPLSCDAP